MLDCVDFVFGVESVVGFVDWFGDVGDYVVVVWGDCCEVVKGVVYCWLGEVVYCCIDDYIWLNCVGFDLDYVG